MTRPFTKVVQHLDYPMFIVTAAAADAKSGCLVGFATQCSIKPPRFLVCLSKLNRTYEVARNARALAVHVVGRDDEQLAQLFGGETSDQVDKFTRCRWHTGPEGAPVLDDIDNWFVGTVDGQVDLGDHVGFVLVPLHDGEADAESEQLGYQEARTIEPGHAP